MKKIFDDRPVAIYVLLDEDGLPCYVGKSVSPNRRLIEHKGERSFITCLLVLEWTTHKEFRPREREWIKTFHQLGFLLTNKINGGGGLPFQTEEERRKISERLRGHPGAMRGKRHSLSTRRKMSAVRTGQMTPAMLAVRRSHPKRPPHTPESKEKMRQSALLREYRPLTESHKKKIGDSQRGRTYSPERVNAMKKARWPAYYGESV